MKKIIKFFKDLFSINKSVEPLPISRENTLLEIEIVEKINEYRAMLGLQPVFINKLINQVSYKNNVRMIELNQFNHNGAVDRFKEVKKICNTKYEAEILALNFSLANSIITAWKESEGHNRQMVKPNINQVGISFLDRKVTVIFAEI